MEGEGIMNVSVVGSEWELKDNEILSYWNGWSVDNVYNWKIKL